jgi:hypothetical protein
MLSVLMILLAAALPQRGALRHIIRTAPLRPPAPSAARARPTHGPHTKAVGPRFLKGLDARFMAARSARLSPKPGRAPYQFRKIQVCPKDLPAALRQDEPAVDRAHGAVGCWWSLLGGRKAPCPT